MLGKGQRQGKAVLGKGGHQIRGVDKANDGKEVTSACVRQGRMAGAGLCTER